MRPRRTPTSNKVFRLEGGNEDNDLWCEHALTTDGRPVILSTWELTDAERELVTKGANIELCVFSGVTPPVSLAVTIVSLGKEAT